MKMKKCHEEISFERHFVYFYILTKTLSGSKNLVTACVYAKFLYF
jgi:hypothetical protein